MTGTLPMFDAPGPSSGRATSTAPVAASASRVAPVAVDQLDGFPSRCPSCGVPLPGVLVLVILLSAWFFTSLVVAPLLIACMSMGDVDDLLGGDR